MQFLETVYVANIRNTSNQKILINTATLAKVIVTMIELLYLSSALLYLINPVSAYITKGEFETLLFVFIPGVDPKRPIGYAVHLVYHLMMVFFGVAGTCCSDIFCFSTVIQLRPMQQILRQNIRELNEMLAKSPYTETALVKMQLRNILLMHKDLYMYEDNKFRYITFFSLFYVLYLQFY